MLEGGFLNTFTTVYSRKENSNQIPSMGNLFTFQVHSARQYVKSTWPVGMKNWWTKNPSEVPFMPISSYQWLVRVFHTLVVWRFNKP